MLAAIDQKLGKQVLEEVANVVKPGTILAWHRMLVAQKFDGSQQRKGPGRPTIDQELEALVVRLAQENRSWGYDRIVGALANLSYTVSDQTVGNISSAMVSPRLLNARRRPPGASLSARIWMSLWPLISSQVRFQHKPRPCSGVHFPVMRRGIQQKEVGHGTNTGRDHTELGRAVVLGGGPQG